MTLDPQSTYVHLGEDGAATPLSAAGFWDMPAADAARFGGGWTITEFTFSDDWSNWERHPAGDEFVYLLAGAADLWLELNGALRIVALQGSGAVLVPRGTWHTARIKAPSRMLFVTRGEGTEHRPD
ncbi:cupin [Massilia sp. YMA4]|uniref:cupin domain-containing protein n=1 Tax=Massilia sp. YMA4 TaxID=1593482 RepID=UPI000DD13F49|nr:cupin [Massilia sp. YMA4]AXA91291.1 cupin [Massilia sp. YMA4]